MGYSSRGLSRLSIDESGHLALVNTGDGEIVSKEVGPEEEEEDEEEESIEPHPRAPACVSVECRRQPLGATTPGSRNEDRLRRVLGEKGGGGGGGGRFIQSERSERGGPRARPRYPGVGDETRRTTFLRETHPYPSVLLYCLVE